MPRSRRGPSAQTRRRSGRRQGSHFRALRCELLEGHRLLSDISITRFSDLDGDGTGIEPLELSPVKTFAVAHQYTDDGTTLSLGRAKWTATRFPGGRSCLDSGGRRTSVLGERVSAGRRLT